MSGDLVRLRAGFIPLVDAAVLIVAADRGFAAEEGLALDLVREVSWSNVRDKLKLGHFDAAHVLAPLPIAETLGVDYARVPMTVPFALNLNGNSIIVNTETAEALASWADGDLTDPAVSGASLKRLIGARRQASLDPLTFGMTFPVSTHNYLLRFWMAAAGIDPDRDVRLVVLPPPYMVDSLRSGHVQGFCVGAPWPSVAVEAGLGQILHFGTDIIATCPEKVLAVRSDWADAHPDLVLRLTRALIRAAAWCATPENRVEMAYLLSAAARVDVAPEIILRILEGRLRVDASGRVRENARYMIVESRTASRPDSRHALWLYAQMVRWGQTNYDPVQAAAAAATYRADVFDAALRSMTAPPVVQDGLGAFAGPPFDPDDIAGHLQAWSNGARGD
jgi:NitT/TauT family transport system ATP-binding protein